MRIQTFSNIDNINKTQSSSHMINLIYSKLILEDFEQNNYKIVTPRHRILLDQGLELEELSQHLQANSIRQDY